MSVVLYMAITANGFIATVDDDTSFTTDLDWQSFQDFAEKAGNLILGRHTYEIMVQDGSLADFQLDDVVIVGTDVEVADPLHHVAASPELALEILTSKGYEQILVAGGAKLNAAFMQARLIDEIYLDIEPIIFGQGIPLFSGLDFEIQLELIKTKKLSDNEIQLHYRVLN